MMTKMNSKKPRQIMFKKVLNVAQVFHNDEILEHVSKNINMGELTFFDVIYVS